MLSDANGSVIAYANDVYTWDVRNRLVALDRGGDFPLSATFRYDWRGRRVQKGTDGVVAGMLNDGDNAVAELSGGGTTPVVHGPFVDMPLSRGGLFYGQDGLGSVTKLFDETGAAVAGYGYEPFGEVSSGTFVNPYQFTGRENDRTGLYYYRARYYAPEWGRFISEDPIGFAGGINQYVYVENNPATETDPSGLSSFFYLDERSQREFERLEFEGRVRERIGRWPRSNEIGEDPNGGFFYMGSLALPPGGQGTIDPRLLQAGRSQLNGGKVLDAWRLRAGGSAPPPIEITPDGVIVDGNSRARVAAMRGENIPYRVVGGRIPGQGPVLDRPLFWAEGQPSSLPWLRPAGNGSWIGNVVSRIRAWFRR